MRKENATNKTVGEVEKYLDAKSGKSASFNPLPTGTGPVPVRPISQDVQLTPIVQPIAMVPYSTQEQPLLMFDNDATYADPAAEYYYDNAVPVAEPAKKEKKGIHAAPVLLILLSLLILAVYVAGYFVFPEYLALKGSTTAESGLAIIMGIVSVFQPFDLLSAIPAIAITLCAVMVILVLLASLFGITKKKATRLAKVALILAQIFALLALAVGIVMTGAGAGMYIVTGLCLVATIIGFAVRSK